ncbi:MAG: DUF1684 domain-containing protein [Chloroflexi bacterium]|nr:DUF1684 domain-containing protein [Chloroflexota bacterium]
MSELDEFRCAKDEWPRTAQESPIPEAARATFAGLRYYPEVPALAFDVAPEPFAEREAVAMETSRGAPAEYERWARVRFAVDGAERALTVFRSLATGELFLPFQDANAGGETYGAGRYLELPELGDGRLWLDFNYACNPYCAYDECWSCPLPPAENRLVVAIRAGEHAYEAAH